MESEYIAQIGDRLLGRPLRLHVLLELNSIPFDSVVTQADVARALGEKTDRVGDELERLAVLGMISKPSRERRNEPKRFRKLDHPLWQVAGCLATACAEGGPST